MIYHLSRPAEGGMLKVLSYLLQAVKLQGHKQELWTSNGQLLKTAEKLEISVSNWPLFDRMSLYDLIAVWQQRKLQQGLVFYHGFKSFLMANPRANPVVVCFYNSLFPPYGNQYLRQFVLRVKKRQVKNLKAVVVPSKAQAKEAKKLFSKIEIIPSGVDTQRFIPAKNRQKVIGFLGRLRPEKGVDLILEVARFYPDWFFELAGSDLEGYQTRNLPPNVKLLGTLKNPEDVIKHWSVMVLPSYTEAMPLAILEAMSASLPIIATDTGDVKELIETAGIVIPVGDKLKFKEALDKITKEEKLRQELGIRAREKALAYDWSRVIKMWLDLIQKWEVGP